MEAAVREEQKPYVVVPVPVRDRIYARLVAAEAEVGRLREELRARTAELREAEETIETVRRLVAAWRKVLLVA